MTSGPQLFKVRAWGDPTAAGIFKARYVTIGGVIKEAQGDDDASVANEYICNRLALALGLPVPPGAFTEGANGRAAFVSLQFGEAGAAPPPVIPADVVQGDPQGAASILAFDVWVGNRDRHAGNMAYDPVHGVPLTIFDHGLCLGGRSRAEIRDLSLWQRRPIPGQACLSGLLTSGSDLATWAAAISNLPIQTIRSIIGHAVTAGVLTPTEGQVIGAWLDERRQHVLPLLRLSHPNVTDWGML